MVKPFSTAFSDSVMNAVPFALPRPPRGSSTEPSSGNVAPWSISCDGTEEYTPSSVVAVGTTRLPEML